MGTPLRPAHVPGSRPAAGAGRWLRRIGREEFARLMGACVESVLEQRGGIDPERACALAREALQRFGLRLERATRPVRALTRSECLRELEATHGALLREHGRQEAELDELARALAEARARGGSGAMEPPEEAELERLLAEDLEGLLASADPRSEVPALLERLRCRRAGAITLAVERERARIDLLERRLAKLLQANTELERALDELAHRAAIDGGLPSIYRAVQGLDPHDERHGFKAALLDTVFEQNLQFQKRAA